VKLKQDFDENIFRGRKSVKVTDANLKIDYILIYLDQTFRKTKKQPF